MISSKAAPAKMVHFISELVTDLPLRCKVVSVEVEDMAYAVTLWLPDRGLSVQQLSAYEMSRSMRGDPEAVAILRDQLVKHCANGSGRNGSAKNGSAKNGASLAVLHESAIGHQPSTLNDCSPLH